MSSDNTSAIRELEQLKKHFAGAGKEAEALAMIEKLRAHFSAFGISAPPPATSATSLPAAKIVTIPATAASPAIAAIPATAASPATATSPAAATAKAARANKNGEPLEWDGVEELTPENCNATSHHNAYMRFLRKMSSQKCEKLHPTLVQKFKDEEATRSTLFIDFWKAKENLTQMELLVERRLTDKQEGKVTFKKYQYDDLLAKFHGDKDYVDAVVADCTKNKRFCKDKLMPENRKKDWYWGVDEETFTISKAVEDRATLSAQCQPGAEAAEHMISGASPFANDQVLGMQGLDNRMMLDLPGGFASKAKGKAKAKPGNKGKETGKETGKVTAKDASAIEASEGAGAGEEVCAEAGNVSEAKKAPESDQAPTLAKSLATAMGTSSRVSMELKSIGACDQIAEELQSLNRALAGAYQGVQTLINQGFDSPEKEQAFVDYKGKCNRFHREKRNDITLGRCEKVFMFY